MDFKKYAKNIRQNYAKIHIKNEKMSKFQNIIVYIYLLEIQELNKKFIQKSIIKTTFLLIMEYIVHLGLVSYIDYKFPPR